MRLPVGPVRGLVTFVLIATNTVVCCIPLLAIALSELAVPVQRWRRVASRWLTAIAEQWIANNMTILRATQDLRLDIRGVEGLARNRWYLVVSNHRSWVDVFAVQAALNRRIPFLKFFVKKQLIWVPLIGLAWWALDMPFMQRHSKTYLEKHPEKRGQDLETTRRACERFRLVPTSVISFVEGTRFTPAKKVKCGSPYRNLLPPRAGGVAFVLGAMGSLFQSLVDVTIAYPKGAGGMWDLCCGRLREIVVDVQARPIDSWLTTGDYAGDAAFRARFQQWLAELWSAKDARLEQLVAVRG